MSRWSRASEQGELAPFPVAIHVDKANRAQPRELTLHVQQLVRRIVVLRADVQAGEKRLVERSRRRGDVFEVAEDASGAQQAEHVFVQRPLALVADVVNREAGDDGVEDAQLSWQRPVEIVGDDLH